MSTLNSEAFAAFLKSADTDEFVSGLTNKFPVTIKSPSIIPSTSITCRSAYIVPDTTMSPPKSVTPALVKSLFDFVPDTNKKTSVPTSLSIDAGIPPDLLVATDPLYIMPPIVEDAIPPDSIIFVVSTCVALKSFAIFISCSAWSYYICHSTCEFSRKIQSCCR